MYKRFNNGYAFERYVFGEPTLKREAHQIENKAVTMSTALRRVIANANGHSHPETDVGHGLWYFVSKFVGPHLPVKKLGFYSSIKTDADFRYGVDGFFYLVSQDRESLAVIDAFMMPDFLVRKLQQDKQIESCVQIQDKVYRMKRIVKLARSGQSDDICWARFWKMYNDGGCYPFPRFRNSFVITPYDLSRPKGVQELGKEIAKSLFVQIQPKTRMPF
jgi:hypothetical protein